MNYANHDNIDFQQYGCEQYRNLAEDEKQKLIKYRKKYFKIRRPY